MLTTRIICRAVVSLPKKAVLILIRLYQRTLSPDHGMFRIFRPHGFCRFYPSCSEYCYQSVEKFGIFRGFQRFSARILRCNPWNKGGIDEVKE